MPTTIKHSDRSHTRKWTKAVHPNKSQATYNVANINRKRRHNPR